jgi:hypothetical protein
MGLFWTTGKNNESLLGDWKQLRPRSGRLLIKVTLWTTGNNYGRKPAAFLNQSFPAFWTAAMQLASINNWSLLDN